MVKLADYVASEIQLKVTGNGLVAVRAGSRAVLKDKHGDWSLGRLLANRLPYHYRTVEGIVSDFAMGNAALEAALDLAANAPTTEKFQRSHCGEILASTFVEEHLGLRRLYSKLTLTSSENTNVHKMDGLFVDVNKSPREYVFVEAKSSILPTFKTNTKSHRSGILRQMLESLTTYSNDDPRFELTRIRDNLQKEFDEPLRSEIRAELMPPGPQNLKVLGISVTNAVTVNDEDDDFILTEGCQQDFDYRAIVVSDLASLAGESYGYWAAIQKAVSDVQP